MSAGLVVFDVDSTLAATEGVDLLADIAGCGPQVADITARAMAGHLDFAAALRERVALLAGLPVAALSQATERVRITQDAARTCAQLRERGWVLAAVSGGFAAMVEPLGRQLGLAAVRANHLEVKDGFLTGRVAGPIVDSAGKAAALREWAEQFAVPLARTVAVGDGANDIAMVQQAGFGVGFRPKDALRKVADAVIEGPSLWPLVTLLDGRLNGQLNGQ